MVEKQELLTQDGYNKLEEELEYLKAVKRKEVAERLKVAISFGDLSENAEYDEAKNEQSDVIIVACHWGKEDVSQISDLQKEYAQYFADLGVDVVIGILKEQCKA